MARTDVHRPSSPMFDPQAYQCVGVYDNSPDPLMAGDAGAARNQAVSSLVGKGYRFGAGSSDQCGHCGARIRYAALMVRADVKEFIFVGEDCLDNRFQGMTRAEFQSLRKTASLNRERTKKAERIAEVYAGTPGLEAALKVDNAVSEDIRWRLQRTGEISAKQIELVFKIQKQEAERAQRQAEREAQDAALIESGVQVPTGRVTVTGVVLSVKVQDTMYGITVKMLVQSVEGWKVWGTVPSSLIDVQVGQTVEFTATLEASQDDVLFGFYKRPTKAQIVEASKAA